MNTPSRPLLHRIALWLAVGWLAVFTITFYVLRNPFTGGAAAVMLHNVLDTLAVAALVWLGGAIGGRIMPDLGRFDPLERVSLQALTGLGAVGLAVLILGLAGPYPPGWLAWAITLGGLAILHRAALGWLRTLGAGLSAALLVEGEAGRLPSLRSIATWVVLGCLALLALTILPALAPPADWDSLVLHLAGPRLFIQAGRVIPFPELSILGFPFLTETLYLWLMLMARPQAAALLHAAFGLLVALLLIGRGRQLDRPLAGWLALLILLINTEIQYEFHQAFVDLSAMAYATAALWLVLAAFEDSSQPDLRRLAWAGVMAGLALGTKYTLLSAALGLGLLTLWLARRGGVGRILRAGAALAGPALVVFAPWLVKNALMYGNPVAPFVWGTVSFDQIDQTDALRAGSGLSGLELIRYPLLFTFLGGIGDWWLYGSPGPLLPGLLPLALIGWGARPRAERAFIVLAAAFFGVGVLFWLYGASTSYDLISLRYLLPFIPALALVSGLGLDGLREVSLPVPVVRLSRLMVLLAALGSPLVVGWATFQRPEAIRASFGMVREEDYLAEMLPAYYDTMQQMKTLPPDARVMMLWESRTYYCQRTCIPDTLLNRWSHDLRLQPNPRAILARWRAMGITHVLISEIGLTSALSRNDRGVIYLDPADVPPLDAVRQTDLRLLWRDPGSLGAYSLYELP